MSAVQKIARVMKLPDGLQLYRGLGGLMDLPDRFWASDCHGCRGYAEWGFLSTTSNRATAIEYSGVKDGRPLAMLLQLTVGSVDRGACIAEFSQYPGEVCRLLCTLPPAECWGTRGRPPRTRLCFAAQPNVL